jgi:hypothetical protein
LEQQDIFADILSWLHSNWGWLITAFCVFFEIAPIKLHPITFVCNWVGKKLTNDIKNDISDLRYTVDMNRIASIKANVLQFANSCRNGRGHSKEEFMNIMNENNEYEALIKKYDIRNHVYKEDYAFVVEKYRECMHNNSFLA